MRVFAIAVMAMMFCCSAAFAQIEIVGANTLPGPTANPSSVASWQDVLYYAVPLDNITHYGLSPAPLPQYPFDSVFHVRDCGSELLILASESVDTPYDPYYEYQLSVFRWDGATLTKTSPYWITGGNIQNAGAAVVYQGTIFSGGVENTSLFRSYEGDSWHQISINGSVRALEVIDDELYAVGAFTSVEAVAAQSVARFDGASWSAFGAGLPNTARTITRAGGEYFATTSSELWQWQALSDTWIKVADAGGGLIADAAAWNGGLVLVGNFSSMNGTSADYVVKYDGSVFHALPGGPNGPIDSVSPHLAGFVVEGEFLGTATEPANFAAVYDGSAWIPARPGGLGVAPSVNRITTYGSELLVASYFSCLNAPSTTAAYGIARFAPTGWAGLAGGLHGGGVSRFLEHNGVLYVQGDFQTTGGVQGWPSDELSGWATWDGSEWASWTPPPYSFSGDPFAYCMVSYDGDIVVGSTGFDFGDQELMARWDGISWTSFPSESPLTGAYVSDVIEFDGMLHVGGRTMWVTSLPGDHAALYWDGVQWHETGVSDWIARFFVWNGDLYADGRYTYRWDTDHWTNAWQIHPDIPEQLLLAGGKLYKTTAHEIEGGTWIGELLQWFADTGWVKVLEVTRVDAFGNVQSGSISDLVTLGETTYAVGYFTHLNGVRCDNFGAFTGEVPVAVEPQIPSRKLGIRAFPNPANPKVSFTLEFDRKGPVRLDIYDSRGRKVRTLIEGQVLVEGSPVVWDGRSDSGAQAASGVYFAHVRYGEDSATTKFTLVK